MGIGSDKSARAQKRAAEITGGNRNAIGQIFLEQNIKHRNPGRALRLSVVRIAAYLPLTQNIGINIMRGVPVL